MGSSPYSPVHGLVARVQSIQSSAALEVYSSWMSGRSTSNTVSGRISIPLITEPPKFHHFLALPAELRILTV